MFYDLLTASDDSSGAQTVIIAPVPYQIPKRSKKIKASKTRQKKQITSPGRRRGSIQTGFRNLPTGKLAALLPGLYSATVRHLRRRCPYPHHRPRKPQGNRNDKDRKGTKKGRNASNGKFRVSKNQHSEGASITAVSAGTASREGWSGEKS